MASRRVNGVSSYFLFTFEQLHNLRPGISKFLKKCTVDYMSLDRLRTTESWKGI